MIDVACAVFGYEWMGREAWDGTGLGLTERGFYTD